MTKLSKCVIREILFTYDGVTPSYVNSIWSLSEKIFVYDDVTDVVILDRDL